MEGLVNKVCKLVEKAGYDEAVKSLEYMAEVQGVKTFEQLEDAIEEELILLEVD